MRARFLCALDVGAQVKREGVATPVGLASEAALHDSYLRLSAVRICSAFIRAPLRVHSWSLFAAIPVFGFTFAPVASSARGS